MDTPLTRTFAGPEHSPFGRRLRSPRGARVPVVVVTGFLGAGKTTLIRNVLATPDGANSLVIVNEFGEVGIDDALIRTGGDATVLLGNGCMCCALRSDLQATLRDVLTERTRGTMPPFERIILETSGLADPVPILQTLTGDRTLAAAVHLNAVVTVVDAVLGAGTLASAPEARRQVAVADRFVVTKSDIAGEAAATALEARLVRLNSGAAIIRAEHRSIHPDVLLADNAALGEPTLPAGEAGHHSDGIETFCLTFGRPLDWAVYENVMDILAKLRGADLLRAKGLLEIAGCRGPVVVHQVQHLSAKPVELQAWPDGKAASRLVFITRGIERADVEGLFATALRLAAGASGDQGTDGGSAG